MNNFFDMDQGVSFDMDTNYDYSQVYNLDSNNDAGMASYNYGYGELLPTQFHNNDPLSQQLPSADTSSFSYVVTEHNSGVQATPDAMARAAPFNFASNMDMSSLGNGSDELRHWARQVGATPSASRSLPPGISGIPGAINHNLYHRQLAGDNAKSARRRVSAENENLRRVSAGEQNVELLMQSLARPQSFSEYAQNFSQLQAQLKSQTRAQPVSHFQAQSQAQFQAQADAQVQAQAQPVSPFQLQVQPISQAQPLGQDTAQATTPVPAKASARVPAKPKKTKKPASRARGTARSKANEASNAQTATAFASIATLDEGKDPIDHLIHAALGKGVKLALLSAASTISNEITLKNHPQLGNISREVIRQWLDVNKIFPNQSFFSTLAAEIRGDFEKKYPEIDLSAQTKAEETPAEFPPTPEASLLATSSSPSSSPSAALGEGNGQAKNQASHGGSGSQKAKGKGKEETYTLTGKRQERTFNGQRLDSYECSDGQYRLLDQNKYQEACERTQSAGHALPKLKRKASVSSADEPVAKKPKSSNNDVARARAGTPIEISIPSAEKVLEIEAPSSTEASFQFEDPLSTEASSSTEAPFQFEDPLAIEAPSSIDVPFKFDDSFQFEDTFQFEGPLTSEAPFTIESEHETQVSSSPEENNLLLVAEWNFQQDGGLFEVDGKDEA
ncbi:hypothetical protein PT974_10163 [Cladobotryum mycophilum]|uniref:Uncharacterized protein n=1 Tax=Cladobotryum mycophilum TaxID=491253 RepID=A0ABR0S933_9HYPO